MLGVSAAVIFLPMGAYSAAHFLTLGDRSAVDHQHNLTRLVNPFIGTGGSIPYMGGDTFPGAAYPFGMVQWSPDTPTNPPGGYFYSDSTIKGFSLTHFSGRGCQVYQDFPFMPYVGRLIHSPATNSSLYYSNFTHRREATHPGYYQVHLNDPDVTVELSVTPHTGVGRFTYPDSAESTMIINAGGSINGNTNSSVTIIPGRNEVTGYAESVVGCGYDLYRIYFAARFDRSFSSYGTWDGDIVTHGSTASGGQQAGAFVVFNTTGTNVIHIQVGISFVSIANAELNLAAENARFDFDAVARDSDAAWNHRLQSILVEGGTYDERVAFYTALYHAFFHPNVFNDANGQYLGFDGKVHNVPYGHAHYENIPSWDQYRTQIVLLSILEPSVASDVAQSLVDDAQQGDGHIPRWVQANADSRGMSGDGGSIMISQAYAYGARNFDTAGALNAMINGQSNIREAIKDYLRIGYVPADTGLPSASITLEYASADFAIAQFAHALGDSRSYSTFLQRSGNWQNVFNPASGYIQTRNGDGGWSAGFTPTSQAGFHEGDSSQYTWMVPHNLRGLFDQMGGNPAVVKRLDNFFTKLNDGWASPHAHIGNQPSVEIPWEYAFAQAPSHTQAVVRRIQTELFKNAADGLPGNDDGGSTSSWYIFSAIGIYPEIPGIGGFVIGSPLFTSVTLHLDGRHTLQINASDASDIHPYVQNLKINGDQTSRLWLPWSTVQQGATLEFALGSLPTDWGSNPQDAPPSYPSNQ
jgi:predicted alpha-1,2-mannosidase